MISSKEVDSKDYTEEVLELGARIKAAEKRAFLAEEELKYLKISRLIGPVIRFRDSLRGAQKGVFLFVKKFEYFIADHMNPRTKKALKYFLSREWLVKEVIIEGEAWPANKPLVSVITPTWNRGKSAFRTIQSILGQTFQDFEYIIVDDGSEDMHRKAIELIKDPKIKTYFLDKHLESHPPAMARNFGASKARGKYVVCIDDDDWLEPTYLEKALLVLESNPNISIVSSFQRMFGAREDVYRYAPYNPKHFLSSNMVMHSAMYLRKAWETVGGYKEDICYEDWEFWINLAENGFWGKLIPEALFNYQVSANNSRYIEDLNSHSDNMHTIKSLHPRFKQKVGRIWRSRRYKKLVLSPASAFMNLSKKGEYLQAFNKDKNVLIAIPWMTFGGAETLIYNYCREIKDKFNISFVTGLVSEHEWEYKFKEITTNIYHLPNLFDNKELYLEFVSNYIKTRDIEILHIIHNGFMFEMLPELKKRHPKLKVIVTMFNDRVEYFEQSLRFSNYIDVYSTDNNAVGKHYREEIGTKASVRVIPNGIDCFNNFKPELFDRETERNSLLLSENDLAVFFIGRLSEEKRPNVFLEVAAEVLNKNPQKNVKFFMIGDGPLRSKLEDQIEKIGNINIRYLGYQSNVAKYLSAADIFVLPSIIEGFPLSLLEAMAMRVAIIASNVGAVSDVVVTGQDGFVVSPASTSEIVEIINKLNKNRKLLGEVKANARKEIEGKYSNILLGENYASLYNKERM